MPPKRPRNLRNTRKSLADWSEPPSQNQAESADKPQQQQHQKQDQATNGGSTDTGKTDMVDLMEFQRFRRQKQRGIDVEALAKGERKRRPAKTPFKKAGVSEGTREGERDEEDDEAADDARSSQRSATRSLDGAFTVQTNKLDVNKHMMAYIEKEMGRRSGSTSGPDRNPASAKDGAEDDSAQKQLSVDDLYHVPEHLRVVETRPVSEGNVAMASKMLTSIPEVDLGVESRIRNIRATNRVVAGMSGSPDSAAQHDAPPAAPSPGSTRYRKYNDPSDRSSKATDDIVLQRFKKRMRR
ncbi:hypothetical protein GQ54DRAFT_288385 [Martensiomyces pterosporus]|nr:hypothetical protein GQ54DRAFT_288385 [Martensiomyces pterosporus]